MQHALCLESKLIAEDLYAILQKLDPSTWSEELEATVREQLNRLNERLRKVLASWEHGQIERHMTALLQRLQELARVIEELAPTMKLSTAPMRAEWQAFRRRAYPAYEALAASLSLQAIHVPSLRPTNYARKVFHLASGLVALALIQFVLSPLSMVWMSLAFVTYAWSMEAIRRRSPRWNAQLMRLYGRVAHAHEYHRVNSATWYCTALLVLSLTCTPMVCSLAVIVLAVADPAAALLGRRFGRIRLRAGRSLEGTASFVVTGWLASLLVMTAFYPEVSIPAAALISLSGAVFGAVAELVSQHIDDNLTIPLATALGTTLTVLALGL